MSLNIPDYMPILSGGAHESPKDGACIMEMASFINGEEWSDRPSCTNTYLARAARIVNDKLNNEERQRLLPLLPRLMGTTEPLAEQVIFDAAADAVTHLVSHPNEDARQFAKEAIGEAGRGTHYGIVSAVLAAQAAEEDIVALLSALIDAYDKTVGRTEPAIVTADDLRRCAELTGAKA